MVIILVSFEDEPLPTAQHAHVPKNAAPGCVAPPDATLHDVDLDDEPEKPWWRAPNSKLTVYFENHNVSERYWGMVRTAAEIWSRSACVQAVAVEKCPPGANCVAVRQKRIAVSQLNTDGEFRGEDSGRYRTGGTLILYSWYLGRTSDNGALATVVHEMGHAFGLVHRNDEHDVMHAQTDNDTNPVPDETDFRNLCVIYGQRG